MPTEDSPPESVVRPAQTAFSVVQVTMSLPGPQSDLLDGQDGVDSLDGGPGTDTCLNGEADSRCNSTILGVAASGALATTQTQTPAELEAVVSALRSSA
jgi:hypothetical protein